MSDDVVIVAAARTAIGNIGGTLANTLPYKLGATVILPSSSSRQVLTRN